MTMTSKKKKPVYAGLSITHSAVELVVFSPKSMAVEQAFLLPLPPGLFDMEMDTVRDVSLLKDQIAQVLAMANPRPMAVHLSVPGTLMRIVETPKMDEAALYLSLSSEAERYKTFDHTEAAVDFVPVPNPYLPANTQQLMLGAMRRDSLETYLKILRELKVKLASVSLEPVNILRGLATSGVLDALVKQIGPENSWGMIFVEASRVRFTLWRADRLVEFRELVMDTSEFKNANINMLVVEDLLEEVRRTTKNEIPSVWLTSNMPVEMERMLSQRLQVPMRSAPMGNALTMPDSVRLSGLGAATSSQVPFPFDLDILEGVRASGTMGSMGVDKTESQDGGSAPDLLIPAGLGSIGLGLVATVILYAMAFFSGLGLPELQTKVDSLKTEVLGLRVQEKTLRSKVNLNMELQNVLRQAKARTSVYVALTNELKEKTPTDQVWIQALKVVTVGDSSPLELTGKALNHQSVINFARSFDDVPYTKAVLIDAITEGKLSGNLIYDFKLSGSINLAPMLAKMGSDQPGQAPPAEGQSTTPPPTNSGA